MNSDEFSLTGFHVMVQEAEGDEPYFQNFWAGTDDLGYALERIASAARRDGFERPLFAIADPVHSILLSREDTESEDGFVHRSIERIAFPPESSYFEFPTGIIPSGQEGEHHPDQVREGFAMTRAEAGFFLAANVSAESLLHHYCGLIEALGEARVFWYQFHDTEGEPESELFVNEAIHTAAAVRAHLLEDPSDNLHNGFVTLTTFFDEGSMNVKLSDHKRLRVSTLDEATASKARSALLSLGLAEDPELVSIDGGCHHWHYREPAGRTHKQLKKHLLKSGFKAWSP